MRPHPHQVVAIIVRIVRIGIGRDDPERDEVAEVAMVEVVVLEATGRNSAEARPAGHGSKPRCTKSAASRPADGHTTVEGAAAAVEPAAPMSAATRGSNSSASTQCRLPPM